MNYIFILFCSLFVPFAQSFKTQRIEAEEPFLIDDVADYEVVPVRHMLHKRNINELAIQTKINGKAREIYLQPSEGLLAGTGTKIMTAKTIGRNNVTYTLWPDAMKNIYLNFYQNRATSSSITHRINEDGESEFNGIINDNLVIRPMPKHLRKRRDLLKAKPASFDTEAKGFINAGEHIIYKQTFNNNSQFSEAKMSVTEIVKAKRVSRRSASGVPNVVYPELMIFVDDILFEKFEFDVTRAIEYTLSFWNAVDLRFRDLETPKVRLNIAGIIFVKGPLPFVKDAIFSVPQGMVDEKKLLYGFGRFLLNEKTVRAKEHYDVSIFMTGRYIIETEVQDRRISGVAFFSGVCQEDVSGLLYISSGLVEDNNGYEGILTAAHELAHILGAAHDEKNETKILKDPDLKACHWNKGYLMSYDKINENQFFLSECSKKEIASVLSEDYAQCVRNNPAINRNNHPVPRILPGKFMSLDEQCRNRGYKSAATRELNCINLKCYAHVNTRQPEELFRPPAEGSPCGNGKYCLNGYCVNEKTNGVGGFTNTKGPQIKPKTPTTKGLSAFELRKRNLLISQCQRAGYKSFVSYKEEDCLVLCSFPIGNDNHYGQLIPVDDGFSCENGHCRGGNCTNYNG